MIKRRKVDTQLEQQILTSTCCITVNAENDRSERNAQLKPELAALRKGLERIADIYVAHIGAAHVMQDIAREALGMGEK